MSRKMKVSLNLLSLTSDPAQASVGDIYFNSSTAKIRVYTATGWQDVSGSGGGSSTYSFHYSSTPPTNPDVGDKWVDSTTGVEFTYIDDGNSLQWVSTTAPGIAGPQGETGIVSASSPLSYNSGLKTLALNPISASDISNGAVTMSKIAQSGAITGQAITWNGSAWAPSNVNPIPSQINNSGRYLTTNGSDVFWSVIDNASTDLHPFFI